MGNRFIRLPAWLKLVWVVIFCYLVLVLAFFWFFGWSVLPFPV